MRPSAEEIEARDPRGDRLPTTPLSPDEPGLRPGQIRSRTINERKPLFTPELFQERFATRQAEVIDAAGQFVTEKLGEFGDVTGQIAGGLFGGLTGLAVGGYAGLVGSIRAGENPADVVGRVLEGAAIGAPALAQEGFNLRNPAAITAAAAPSKGAQNKIDNPIGRERDFIDNQGNVHKQEVVAHTAIRSDGTGGNPVWRDVGELSAGERTALEQIARKEAGLGPSGTALLGYLDTLVQGDTEATLPGFGGAERAAEVARFTAATQQSQVGEDETGTLFQSRAMFSTSVFFTERAYERWAADGFPATPKSGSGMPRVATENVWDMIASRNNWGMTGAEFLESQGYEDQGGGVWIKNPEPQITGYGGGGFGSGAGDGSPGFGFPPGARSGMGMVNWRI